MGGKRGTRSEVTSGWRERIRRWQRLDCSISEFCRREGVSQASFFHWRKRFGSDATKRRTSASADGVAFVPVQVVPDGGNGSSSCSARRSASDPHAWLEISRGDLVCRVWGEVDEVLLRRLVRVLSEEGSRC